VFLIYLGVAYKRVGERETGEVEEGFGLVNPNSLLAVDLAARREAEEEEPLDLTGFCVCELCGWGRLTYASTRTLDGLSMYFSIKRSLFHDICRKSRLAVLPWKRRRQDQRRRCETRQGNILRLQGCCRYTPRPPASVSQPLPGSESDSQSRRTCASSLGRL
jgi:hypothetical protein